MGDRSYNCASVQELQDEFFDGLQEVACNFFETDNTSRKRIKKLSRANLPPSSRESNSSAYSEVNYETLCQCKPNQKHSRSSLSEGSEIHREAKLEGKEVADSQNLSEVNQHLKHKNKILTDALADLQFGLKHLIERTEGPLRTQLCEHQRISADFETQLTIATAKKSTSYRRDIEFLKAQLSATNNTIDDLINVNQELKNEIRVLNFKCDQLHNFIIKTQNKSLC